MPSSTFRFLRAEVAEMEAAALQVTGSIFPKRHVIDALTAKFNASPERAGMGDVKPKQLATWFHNRRYAPRSKELKARRRGTLAPRKTNLQRAGSSSRVDLSAQAGASVGPGNKHMDNGMVKGQMIPQWTYVRRRSVPFHPTECVELQIRDLVLCFQEFEGISLHSEASVVGIWRTLHDSKECQCRFMVMFGHDETEEIVTLAELRHPPVNIRVPIMAQCADCDPPVTILDFTPNECSRRTRLLPNKMKGHEATMVSNSAQEKPANDGVDAIPATSPKTCNVSAPDTTISGRVKAAPEIIEIDDYVHKDR